MHVLLGVGLFAWFDFSEQSLEWHRRVAPVSYTHLDVYKRQPIFRTFFYLPSIVPLVASSMLWLWILNPQYGLLNNILQKLGLYLSLIHI